MQEILDELVERYPAIAFCHQEIIAAYNLLATCYQNDGCVYLCGNGGSAADAEHIVAELMKSFSRKRPLPEDFQNALNDSNSGSLLEGALRAVSLAGHPSLVTAIANDMSPDLIFAQQVCGYGRPGDICWGLSTSGNSKNIIAAFEVARAKGMKTLGMTGQPGGQIAEFCDVCIGVPESETFKVQELHLPVYHALCRMLEERFFG